MEQKPDKSQEYPKKHSGVLKRKAAFMGMWRNCICKYENSKFIICTGLTERKVDLEIPLTPSVEVSFTDDDDSNCTFSVSVPGSSSIVFQASSHQDALLWVQLLRGDSYKSSTLSMNDFNIISVIGRGYYGKVMLVSSKSTGEMYALKTVHKRLLIENKKVHTIMNERNVLAKINHQFIISLKFAFQTDSKFYLGLEYAPGGELFHLIEKVGCLKWEEARLYIAEIALAIDYLHSQGIIYRDLKLENVLLDIEGHVKLADFGLSREYCDEDAARTFCGTTDYLAPEIITREKYTTAVDWWALGILTYELIFGDTPFYDQNRQIMMDLICTKDPLFPPMAKLPVIDFVLKLLDKNPETRANFQTLIGHPFWGDLTFVQVSLRQTKPFFIPKRDDSRSPNNFDSDFTMEPPADSFCTPVSSEAGLFSGFSVTEEDLDIANSPETVVPSSILTLDLIDTN